MMNPRTKVIAAIVIGFLLLGWTLYDEKILQFGGSDFKLEPRP